MQTSVARRLLTPPIRANELELSFGFCYRLCSNSNRSIIVICNYTVCADNGGHPAEQKLTPLNVRRSYFGPILFGGAAGYRPRVRSVYYVRVYHHSCKTAFSLFIKTTFLTRNFVTKILNLALIAKVLLQEEDFLLVVVQ